MVYSLGIEPMTFFVAGAPLPPKRSSFLCSNGWFPLSVWVDVPATTWASCKHPLPSSCSWQRSPHHSTAAITYTEISYNSNKDRESSTCSNNGKTLTKSLIDTDDKSFIHFIRNSKIKKEIKLFNLKRNSCTTNITKLNI